MLERLTRWSERTRPWHAALISVLLSAPCIAAPFFTDDVLHRLVLDGVQTGLATRPSQLYVFLDRDPALVDRLVAMGRLPWWTTDELALSFQRPLSSASLALDHWLAPWSAPVAHLQSLAWVVALVLAVSRLHRRIVPERAMLATWIYALASAFIFAAGWVAARHALLTATFSVLAVERFVVPADAERPPLRDELTGALLFVLALACGEGAAGVPLMIFGLSLVHPRTLRQRVRLLATPMSVLALYLAFYSALGGGARGSGGYLDPVGAPLDTAVQVGLRSLAFAADTYLGLPSDAAHGPGLPVFALIGAVVLAALVMTLRAMPRDPMRPLAALVLSGVIASLPGTLGFYGGRVLLLSLVATSTVAASLIASAPRSEARGLRRLATVLAVALLALAPLLRLGGALGLTAMSFESRDAARRSRDVCPIDGPIVAVGASDPAVAIYTGLYWMADGAPPEGELRLLTMAPVPLRLERTGERSLRIHARSGRFFSSDWERLYRRDVPDALEVELPFGRMRWHDGVIDYEDDVREHWERSCFVRWDGHAAVRVPLPAVGESVDVPWAPGPMGM